MSGYPPPGVLSTLPLHRSVKEVVVSSFLAFQPLERAVQGEAWGGKGRRLPLPTTSLASYSVSWNIPGTGCGQTALFLIAWFLSTFNTVKVNIDCQEDLGNKSLHVDGKSYLNEVNQTRKTHLWVGGTSLRVGFLDCVQGVR